MFAPHSRRNVLRGMMAGTAVTVGLPFLDCFLNSNGDAQADGQALPVYFGTWSQGLGFTPGFWEPKGIGANYENNIFLKPLDPIKHKVTVFSGLRAFMDSNPLNPHGSGPAVCLSGGHPKGGFSMPTLDTIIADSVGTTTRFRSLEIACDGTDGSQSARSATSRNASESSPLAFYQRLFGPEFKDPNASEFTPDPMVMARQSVLSSISERRVSLNARLGASDKARLDEYFTSLRGLEQQLALRLEKPQPIVGCSVPHTEGEEDATTHGTMISDAQRDHRLFSRLVAHAMACDQTRVVNMMFSGGGGGSPLRRPGSSMTFHVSTHEEATDPQLGYQPQVGWFMTQVSTAIAEYFMTLDSFKIGDKTLLDRSLIMYSTDVGRAQIHSQENLPMFLAGGAGGRVKMGLHVPASGQTCARVGLTAQQVMGVPVSTWGTESNMTSKPFTEILA